MAGFIFLSLIVFVFIFNLFSCGGSPRTLRKIFYGTYYAEDGVTDNTDKANSKEAFEKCTDAGLGIKVNVHLSADNQGFISTFDDLSREYGVEKRISQSNADELAAMGLISLPEFLELTDGEVPVILQLVPSDNNEFFCIYTADCIKATGHNNIAVTSFHTGMINWFKKKEKQIFRGLTSAPAKDFTSLPAGERFLTGNLFYNSIARPQFIMYRNKKQSIFVKFAFAIGAIKGIWTITDKSEAEKLEASKDMITVRGFMPENPQFKLLPEREISQMEIDANKKAEEKAARKQAKKEYDAQREKEKRGVNKAFLEAAEDFTEEIEEYVEDAVEEIKEIID